MIEVGEVCNGRYVVFNTFTGIIISKEYRSLKRAMRVRNRKVRRFNKSMRRFAR